MHLHIVGPSKLYSNAVGIFVIQYAIRNVKNAEVKDIKDKNIILIVVMYR